MDHKSKCQAMGQTCRRCNKPNQFTKVCKLNLNRPMNSQRINEIENSKLETVTENVNNIKIENVLQSQYADPEVDYTVNMLSPANDKSTPSKLEIQFGNSKYWVMVDSGSSASLVTERMAKEIEVRDSNTAGGAGPRIQHNSNSEATQMNSSITRELFKVIYTATAGTQGEQI